MSVRRFKVNSIKQGLSPYRDFLAGNPTYVPPSFESIATATLSSPSNTITFSSIPSGYSSLHLRGLLQGDTDTGSWWVRFNGDTSLSNYASHSLEGYAYSSAQSVIAQSGVGTSSGCAASNQNGGIAWSAGTNVFTAAIIDIHNYASTTQNKTVRVFSGTEQNSTIDSICLASGLWLSTSAITSLTIVMSGSRNFAVNSRFALYGVK